MRDTVEIATTRAYELRESALVASVLTQALRDAVRPCPGGSRSDDRNRAQRAGEEARRWIESESTAPWSFLWCCAHLELEPERVRGTLAGRPQRLRSQLSYGFRERAGSAGRAGSAA